MHREIVAMFSPAGDGRWTIECTVDGSAQRTKTIPVPDKPDELLAWILPERAGGDDFETHASRLRIRPKEFGPPRAPMPPILCWPRLIGGDGDHVFERDWTLLYMTEAPGNDERVWSGHVNVFRDEALVAALSPLPDVVGVDAVRAIAPGAIVIVPGNLSAEEVVALQKRCRERHCPLVVWCGTTIPPEHAGLLEVVPTGEPSCGSPHGWLHDLLGRLHGEEGPEDALARALRGAPARPYDAWMLRGMLRPWKCSDDTAGWRQRFRHWRHELDRDEQSLRLNKIAGALLKSARRRLQVVIVSAALKAGLTYFRERTIVPVARDVRWKVHTRTPRWQSDDSDLANPLDALFQRFKVDHPAMLAARLKALAHKGEIALVHLNYEVLTLGDGTKDTVTPDALRRFILALGEVARALDGNSHVRVLVCLHIITTKPEMLQLGPFPRDEAEREAVDEEHLDPLLDALPEKEISDFLKDNDLETHEERRAERVRELVALDYDAMIDRLRTLYGKKLR